MELRRKTVRESRTHSESKVDSIGERDILDSVSGK